MAISSLKDRVNLTFEETAACAGKVSFTLDAASVSEAMKETLKDVTRQAALPGFRPGKAPVSLIKSRFKAVINDEVARMLQHAAVTALNDRADEFGIIMFGKLLEEGKLEEGADYKTAIEVETAPKFEVADYKNVDCSVEMPDTVEKRTEANLEKMKSYFAKFVTIEDAAKKDDMLKVSYESDFIPEESASADVKKMAKSDESWIYLTEPERIPGVNAALIGAEIGKEYEFDANFPADWYQKELAGKKIHYKVKVHEGQRNQPVEDLEELAKRMGLKDSEELLKRNKENSEMEFKADKAHRAKEKVIAALVEKTPAFDFPPQTFNSMVNNEFSRIAEQVVRSEKDVEKFKAEKDKHMEDAKKQASDFLRRYFIAHKIAKAENIKVTSEDILEKIHNIAAYSGIDEKKVYKMLEESGRMSILQMEMLIDKVFDTIAADK